MKRIAGSALAFLSGAGPLQACAVCFGGAGSNPSRGFFWGILLLLLLPLAITGAIAFRIVRSVRRKAALEEARHSHAG